MDDELDELDRQILEQLRHNARASFRRIAKALGKSAPTVAQRVRRMQASGLIEAYTAQVAEGVEDHPQVTDPRGVCAECKDPLYGRSVTRTVRSEVYGFCCGVCQQRFVARHDRAFHRVQGGGSALLLFGWFASFTSFSAACFGSMGACGTGPGLPTTPWERCPPWAPRRSEGEGWAGTRQVKRLYRSIGLSTGRGRSGSEAEQLSGEPLARVLRADASALWRP